MVCLKMSKKLKSPIDFLEVFSWFFQKNGVGFIGFYYMIGFLLQNLGLYYVLLFLVSYSSPSIFHSLIGNWYKVVFRGAPN